MTRLTGQTVKGQRSIGRLILRRKMRHIFETARSVNFNLVHRRSTMIRVIDRR